MTDWKKWIYLPFSPLAWAIACAALLVLTALGASPLRPGALANNLTRTGVLAALLCSCVLNGILLWRQARPRYLTVASTRRAFITTFVLLSLVCIVGTFAAGRGTVAAGLIGPPEVKPGEAAAPEAGYLQTITSGELTFTAILLFSAFWPAPDSLEAATSARKAALRRLSNALENGQVDKTALMDALTSLAGVQVLSWRAPEDESILKNWKKAATTLADRLEPLATADILSQARADLQTAFNALRQSS